MIQENWHCFCYCTGKIISFTPTAKQGEGTEVRGREQKGKIRALGMGILYRVHMFKWYMSVV
jgi:hypothetical protein